VRVEETQLQLQLRLSQHAGAAVAQKGLAEKAVLKFMTVAAVVARAAAVVASNSTKVKRVVGAAACLRHPSMKMHCGWVRNVSATLTSRNMQAHQLFMQSFPITLSHTGVEPSMIGRCRAPSTKLLKNSTIRVHDPTFPVLPIPLTCLVSLETLPCMRLSRRILMIEVASTARLRLRVELAVE